jgi:hypothetical protein
MFRAVRRSSSGDLTVFAASGLHMHVVTGRSQSEWELANQPTNQPTKGLTEGVDLREAQVDVPPSV